MLDVAPASVLLMGLLGLMVIAFSMLRMAMLERKLHRAPVSVERVAVAESRVRPPAAAA